MTQEQKQLLLKDLCARLPYECMLRVEGDWFDDEERKPYDCKLTPYSFMDLVVNHDCDVKPYLRPMSSMTDEEIKYKLSNFFRVINTNIEGLGYIPTLNTHSAIKYIDWLIANHFDIHGLIPMGLALEATKDMYKTE